MDAVQLAYLEVVLARSHMRACVDVESQVAHWLLEGRARPQDLTEARKRQRAAKQAHARAKAAYAAVMVSASCGESGPARAYASRGAGQSPKSPKAVRNGR